MEPSKKEIDVEFEVKITMHRKVYVYDARNEYEVQRAADKEADKIQDEFNDMEDVTFAEVEMYDWD